ncbi:hypothetical protein CAL26_05920 [Bordetella genomosp. 9]|uniref:Phage tail protein n=2 Tax=Bordetella genomosp. 9 TaxID=1416803 RepID=A0A261RP66_9BORD|nr:hypothetical protein CAL26_05920 [Bordetella genomosp. 9]
MQLPVYQTDTSGLFLYPTKANELALDAGNYNIPFGAVRQSPPQAPEGHVARWNGQAWDVVEDHRGDTLYMVGTGKQYTLGEIAEVDGQDARYSGWGEIPAWLTTEAPEVVEPGDGDQQVDDETAAST